MEIHRAAGVALSGLHGSYSVVRGVRDQFTINLVIQSTGLLVNSSEVGLA